MMFGKRKKNGYIRQRKLDEEDEEDGTADDIANKLHEVKNEQLNRKRWDCYKYVFFSELIFRMKGTKASMLKLQYLW